jgi:hypothetical protein
MVLMVCLISLGSSYYLIILIYDTDVPVAIVHQGCLFDLQVIGKDSAGLEV